LLIVFGVWVGYRNTAWA